MERLKHRDLRAVLGVLRQCYAAHDLDGFARRVVSELPKCVPSDITSYNEVNPRAGRITWVDDGPHLLSGPEGVRIFERHISQHPLITYYGRTRDGRALKISDFLAQRQFQRLGIYNEYYRRVDVEHQMAFTLPSPPPLIIGIALNRGRRDFSERDRLLLNLLRPHLIQAYRNAAAFTRMEQEVLLAGKVMEALDAGAIVLAPDGRVRLMTSRARRWVAEYFGQPSRSAERLPEALGRWVKQQQALLAGKDDVPCPRQPLIMERERKRLVVRLVTEAAENLLLLEECQTTLTPSSLEPLGLSRREGEVLAWVAQGKTNAEIGTIIGASPRTVGKHLERIYQKLGVETRTAAAARALEAGRGT